MSKRARFEEANAGETVRISTYIKPEAQVVMIKKDDTAAPAPYGWTRHYEMSGRAFYRCVDHYSDTRYDLPPAKPNLRPKAAPAMGIDAIIARTQAEAAAKAAKEALDRQQKLDEEAEAMGKRAREKKSSSRDKKVMLLFSAIVIGVMSKHRKDLGDAEHFKKRAKEVRSCCLFLLPRFSSCLLMRY